MVKHIKKMSKLISRASSLLREVLRNSPEGTIQGGAISYKVKRILGRICSTVVVLTLFASSILIIDMKSLIVESGMQTLEGGVQSLEGGTQITEGGMQLPDSGIQSPIGGIQPPIGGIQPPIGGIQPPSDGTQSPGDGMQSPGDGTQPPGDGTQPPGDGTQSPGDETQQPGDGTQPPEDGTQPPGDGTQQPGDGTQPPEDGTQPPEDGTQPPEDENPDLIDELEIDDLEDARIVLQEILADRTVIALVYLCEEYPIRGNVDEDSEIVVTVPSGQQVHIKDVALDMYSERWVYVTLSYNETPYAGYIPRSLLACSDEVFLEWEREYFQPRFSLLMRAMSFSYPDVDQFPESYRGALTALKNAHPNWTFVRMNTGLDWNVVVQNQLSPRSRSLVPTSFASYMQDGVYSPGWAYATEGILKYYLDPRNGINEDTIFQFELLTYNESYHTQAAVQNFLNNTFMRGTLPNMAAHMTFAHVFYSIGRELNVSPFFLACRVLQEQGQGTSPLISGTYQGYENLYNYFNVGATGNTNQKVIESGLDRARREGWTNPYLSLYGGAKFVSTNYILRGQDTLYLQKFDVDSTYDGLYWHQYMQNIVAPTSEGRNIRRLYEQAGSIDNTFVFKIPVYNNMPHAASPLPTASSPSPTPIGPLEIILTSPAGYTDARIFLDGMEYAAAYIDGKYVVNAPNNAMSTAVMYKYNESNVPIGMYVWMLSHSGVYTATPIPELEDLLTYHGFSIRITGNSGIRFKTGISANLRNQLLSTGVNGFGLNEYGTLVMNNANRGQYPFVKGGEKIASGRSFGMNEQGTMDDKIYETIGGRHRFTSVLVALPANQYKTEFAFRGYIILTKDGREITLYGPPVWRSIYSLAEQVINAGQYAPGSSADLFLRQLIVDANNAGN